jgi:hypothetical protein
MLIVPAAVAGMALFVFLGGELVKFLWNWLMPDLFGWRTVTFWQALALLALCRILVGGFGIGGRHHRRGPISGRVSERINDRFADRMGARWDAMTPEERDRFRQRVRDRCGFDPADEANHAS